MAKAAAITIPAGLDDALSWLDAARNPEKYAPWIEAVREEIDRLNELVEATGKIDELDALKAQARSKLNEAEAIRAKADNMLIAAKTTIADDRMAHDDRVKRETEELASRGAALTAEHRAAMKAAEALKAESTRAIQDAHAAKNRADAAMAEAVRIQADCDRRAAAFRAAAA
ncbi:MAG: hypothetical protein ACREEP_14125 [Dongiaceae bacterium]